MTQSNRVDGGQAPDGAAGAVVVTGAGSGIGRAVVEEFTAAGRRVIAWDREFAGEPPSPEWRTVDVTDWAQLEAAAADLPPLHAVVTSAGIGIRGSALELGPDHWRKTFAVNVEGTALTATATFGALRRGGGTLVTIGSIAGVNSFRYRAAYCASKSAVIALTKCLANEWAEFGIRAVCVSPGFTRTAMLEESFRSGLTDEHRLLDHTPQRELLEAADIAQAVRALCAPEFHRVTGANVLVDGGWDTLSGF
jgi:NAD(P)-dependent dehydrogenase (short-subunit alcohol dehydrogenase family)